MEGGRDLKIQRLVGPVVVVDGAERVEAALLLSEGGRRRAGGFRVQGAMHALVAAVLLRLSPLDPLPPSAPLCAPERGARHPPRPRPNRKQPPFPAGRPRPPRIAKRRV